MSIPPISSNSWDLFMQNLNNLGDQVQPFNVEEFLKEARAEPAQLTKEQIQALEEDFGPSEVHVPIISKNPNQEPIDATPSSSSDWDD